MKKIMLFCVLALATCMVLCSCSGGGGGGGGVKALVGLSIEGTTWECANDVVIKKFVFESDTYYTVTPGGVNSSKIKYSYNTSTREIQLGENGVLGKPIVNINGLKRSFTYGGYTYDKK